MALFHFLRIPFTRQFRAIVRRNVEGSEIIRVDLVVDYRMFRPCMIFTHPIFELAVAHSDAFILAKKLI